MANSKQHLFLRPEINKLLRKAAKVSITYCFAQWLDLREDYFQKLIEGHVPPWSRYSHMDLHRYFMMDMETLKIKT